MFMGFGRRFSLMSRVDERCSFVVGETMAGTGVDIVVCVKNGRNLAVLRRHRDGSYLTTMGKPR